MEPFVGSVAYMEGRRLRGRFILAIRGVTAKTSKLL
jgi:hypothetical protein